MKKKDSQAFFRILALFILGSAGYLTMRLISPPASQPASAPATDFSAGRAMQDLEIISLEPHPMGEFPAHAAVRDYLLGEIRKLGLEPQVLDTFGLRVIYPKWIIGGGVEDILVRLSGTDPEGAILLIAHYDSTPGGPGAADNGAGAATFLEILRALQAGPPMRQDVVFLFTDGHEPGIIGTHAFTAQHPWFHDIRLVINIDGVQNGPPLFTRLSGGNGLWASALARSAPKPAYISLPYDLFAGGENDLVPFIQAGIPGANFGTIASSQEVHTGLDRAEIVNPGSVQQAGEQLLALVRFLGNQPVLALNAPDQTFFPMLGRLIHYPSSLAVPLAVAAVLCFMGILLYGFRKRELAWKGIGLGCLAILTGLALGIGTASLVWLGIQAIHPDYQYSPLRPHLSDDYLYAAGLILLVFTISTSVIAITRRKVSAFNLTAGALVIWLPGSLAASLLIPGSSFLATGALLAGSLALLLALAVQSRKNAWIWSVTGFLFSAILMTFLWAPLVYFAYLSASFPMLWLMLGMTALWLAAMLPALDWIANQIRWLLPAAGALAGVGFLLAGSVLAGNDSPAPLVNSIGYWLDADSQSAYWVAFVGGYRTDARTTARFQVAFPDKMDKRQMQLLENPVRRPYAELFPEAPQFSVLTSSAPPLALDGPRLDVIEDEWKNNHRVVKTRLTTSMHDRIWIIIPEDTPLLAITVPNNERAELSADHNGECRLRFDGMPMEGIEIAFEFGTTEQIQFLFVEEKTGLPSFPDLSTQPEPGTMRSPGEFFQGDATDFTAIYRLVEVPGEGSE